MPDDFGSYDEEVERRIKMARPVYPRPKAPKPFASVNIVGSITDPVNIAKIKAAYEGLTIASSYPPVNCHKPPLEYDEETELTREIEEAARKAGISTEGLNIPKPSPPKNVSSR